MKRNHYKYHCAILCETFDNRLLSAFTESARETNSNALSTIINDNNNDNNDNTDNKHKNVNNGNIHFCNNQQLFSLIQYMTLKVQFLGQQ